ncbi:MULTISPECIES: hypothetical protein [Acidobacteriaceae]|uniref:hypothetical protein n=1 Tax=Acidobacteriaceae TaxID=204434 RepID=UPI0020B11A5D|nr:MULTISPECIES: hypothetical protein [Acidobacteriaceae]MDW5264937.1 hypothetical protein [Edaphobacter sp.]
MQRGLGGRGLILAGWLAATAICMVPSAAFAGQTAVPAEQQPAAAPTVQAPMTKAQAKELFRSVDEILSFVSNDSKLPIEHRVKRKLISRDQVNRYLTKKFDEDEGTKRMERSEIVLKKFGLLDRDFHLRPFLLSLLTEQIAGFYDNKTKTVSLLDWIPPDQQKPVLAHELTHALQDQKVGLTKWSDVTPENTASNAQEDNQHIQMDEADTARDAVAEGQAMAVFVDYTLRPTGKTLADAPELGDRLQDMASDSSGSPVMARAPLLLQESLLFPYTDGLSFEQAILVKKGAQAAFADVLANPPSSSFEIMNPKAYMSHVPVPVLRLPDIHPLIDAEYAPYDVGVMGELDVRMLTELFGGQKIATALAPEWAGGVYYAAQRKSAVTEAEKSSTASIALLYYSRWKNADSARSFLRIYASEIPRKYSGVVRRTQDEADGNEQIYSTSEGDVLLSLSGKGVFVSEGFELPLARKLRDEIVGLQPVGPVQTAAVQPHELSLGLSHTLSSFGIIRAAALQRYTFEGHPSTAR